MFRKFLLISFSILLHAGAVVSLVYILLPFIKWYLASRPILGIDFYLTANLASVLSQNFASPWAFWNYGWFGGWPQFTYPFLTIYLASFLSRFWDVVISTQMMAMGFTVLFVLGSYFLYFTVSKNHVLSFILATFTGLSGGVYQALTWAGSVPSYSAQAALPWALGFLIWHQQTGKMRYLLASSLVSGISIFIHPLVFMTYIFPAIFILIFTKLDGGLQILAKIKQILIVLVVALIIGLPQFASSAQFAIKGIVRPNSTQAALSTTRLPTQQDINEARFNKAQVVRLYTDNHDGIFRVAAVVGVLFLATLIASRRITGLLEILPYLLLLGYFFFYIWLFGQGISIFHGGWYRVFWSVPIWVGVFAAACWFLSAKNISKIVTNIPIRVGFLIGATVIVSSLAFIYFKRFPQTSTISSVIYRSEVSSAHPDILNTRPTDKEKEAYKNRLLAPWFDANQTNWRMYDPDQTVNLWWNSLYKMPLARGYLDPPIPDEKRGFIFLLDTALSVTEGQPQLVSVFKYPPETAISNALFLVDWGAVKFYEGAHVGGTSSPAVPEHLKNLLVKREEVVNLDYLKHIGKVRTMKYFEFKDEMTSPILSATNASTLGIIASEGGFETVVRSIAERDNINSQRLVPVNLGRYIDEQSLATLKKFDALYLYDYDYKSEKKAFNNLAKYVEGGKKVFVETGVEVKQSEGILSDFFPAKSVKRKGLGKEWELEVSDKNLAKDVDFKKFAPAEFDDDEWKVSYANSEEVRGGTNVILKNHGKVIMASQKIGQGEVVWSGMNLAYHISRYHNGEEAKFFINILSSTLDISKKNKPNFSVNFKNSNNREISFEGARGILFKEMAYDGWSAKKVSPDTRKLEIFTAGPAYPGYMYIPLAENSSGKIRISFSGSLSHKIQILVSFALAVLIAEEVVLRGFMLGRVRRWFWKFSSKRMAIWWEREDEE